MAEIAIPAIALGAMYILSNQGETSENKAKTDTKENFENVSARYQRELHPGNVKSGVPTRPPVNYPVQTYGQLEHNPAFYPAPNAATDRYYRQEVYEKEVEDGGNPSNGSVFKSLTGNEVQKADILRKKPKHRYSSRRRTWTGRTAHRSTQTSFSRA